MWSGGEWGVVGSGEGWGVCEEYSGREWRARRVKNKEADMCGVPHAHHV